jgi:hypothetical protein
MKAILIGGPCDHEVRNIPYSCNYISIPARGSLNVADPFPKIENGLPPILATVINHQYIKDCICFENDKLYFYRHESLSSLEALMAMLNYYVKSMRSL